MTFGTSNSKNSKRRWAHYTIRQAVVVLLFGKQKTTP
jgi:hypothetical protein